MDKPSEPNRPVRPAWKSYLTFVLWLVPAILIVYFSYLILFPKIEYYREVVDKPLKTDSFVNVVIGLCRYVMDYFFFLAPIFILFTLAPEFLPGRLKRFRGVHLFCISYSVNLFALFTVTIVAVTLVILAPLVPMKP